MSEHPSARELTFSGHVEAGITFARAYIQAQFEDSPVLDYCLPYHNTLHTDGVITNTVAILDIIGCTPREKELAKLAAAFHDTVQDWEEQVPKEEGSARVKRKRFIGQNEENSAGMAEAFMDNVNTSSNTKIFTDEDKQLVREAIMATVPEFDMESGTVVQPNVNAETGVIARALALADINAHGIGGPELFKHDTIALFWEDNMDIFRAFNNGSVTSSQLQNYKQRFLQSVQNQIKFVRGRQRFIRSEIDGFPENSRTDLQNLFGKFVEVVDSGEQYVQEIVDMPAEELFKSLQEALIVETPDKYDTDRAKRA